MTLQSGDTIGKYVIRRKLAEGGMAEIYLAAARGPEGFEKDVVIKRIRSMLASDSSFVEMFISEARLASRLNHANLVQIFDFDKHEDSYYLAMEYVPGHSLHEVQKRAKELMRASSPTLAAHLCAEVAKGLHYAHQLTDASGAPLQLVHRDVTPQNVLISFDGAVKLTDFGIAKAGTKLTMPGVLKGKFAYMAPEQARGEAIDRRTDVFALGVVLWELVTGGRLFDGDSEIAVLRAVQTSSIPAPLRLNPDVPQLLSDIILKTLDREPSRRFQTAQELERNLAQFVLTNARSVEDTNVAAYMSELFGDELGLADRPPISPLVRPGTAVMRSRSMATPHPVSPDEDVHADTVVRRAEADRRPATGSVVAAPAPAVPRPVTTVQSAVATRAGRPQPTASSAPVAAGGRTRRSAATFAVIGVVAALVLVVGLVASRTFSGSSEGVIAPAPVAEHSDGGLAGGTLVAAVSLPEPGGGEGAPAGAAPDAGSPGAEEGPAPAVAMGAGVDAGVRPRRPARLVLVAYPYASVKIVGPERRYLPEVESKGRTVSLLPGSYVVHFTHPRRRETQKVALKPGSEQQVSFRAFSEDPPK